MVRVSQGRTLRPRTQSCHALMGTGKTAVWWWPPVKQERRLVTVEGLVSAVMVHVVVAVTPVGVIAPARAVGMVVA